MPRLDGTGPMGAGPMTGGSRGLCNPYGRSYGVVGFGWDRGYGRGYGRRGTYPPMGGWYGRHPYGPIYDSPYTMKPEDEINMLKHETNYIKDELDAINKRIEELESESSAP